MPNLSRAFAALQRLAAFVGADERGPVVVEEFTAAMLALDYEIRLSEYVAAVFNGEMDSDDLALAHRQLVRSYGYDVYLEGMRDGGIDDPESALTADDEARIFGFINDQLNHVLPFARDAQAARELPTVAERAAAQRAINERVKLWGQRMAEHGAAGEASAQKDRLCAWVLGATEQHCSDCLRYSGYKPHRMSYWLKRALPKNGDLECRGFNCDCTLQDARTGEVLYP